MRLLRVVTSHKPMYQKDCIQSPHSPKASDVKASTTVQFWLLLCSHPPNDSPPGNPPESGFSIHTCNQRNSGDMWLWWHATPRCHVSSPLDMNTKLRSETGQLSEGSEPVTHRRGKSITSHVWLLQLTMLSRVQVNVVLMCITQYRRLASLPSGILPKEFYLN